MNILILQGSPRANGNTAWMAEEYRKAAEAVNEFAEQEKHHGEVTKAILEKYAPEFLEQKRDVKKFVCPLCGYEYEGDLDSEPADWKCPICGMPKSAFKEEA